jgi:hypothetical protein
MGVHVLKTSGREMGDIFVPHPGTAPPPRGTRQHPPYSRSRTLVIMMPSFRKGMKKSPVPVKSTQLAM